MYLVGRLPMPIFSTLMSQNHLFPSKSIQSQNKAEKQLALDDNYTRKLVTYRDSTLFYVSMFIHSLCSRHFNQNVWTCLAPKDNAKSVAPAL